MDMLSELRLVQAAPPNDGRPAKRCVAEACTFGVVYAGGPAGLFTAADPSHDVCQVESCQECCSALALTADGSTALAGSATGRLWRCVLGEETTPLDLQINQDDVAEGGVRCIARQLDADVFAVACGRSICVMDHTGLVHHRLGPLPEAVQHLGWADGGAEGGACLVACTSHALFTWVHGGADPGPVLACPEGAQFRLLATSQRSHFLAAACDACKVHLWDMAVFRQGGSDTAPLTVGSYEDHLSCMVWDASGRRLATADGADCTVWDMDEVEEGVGGAQCEADSIMCCGHDPTTSITSLAFQPDGPLLAAGSDAGKLVMFDARAFRRGGVVGPYATSSLESPGDAFTALTWLPGGRLVAGTNSGQTLLCIHPSADALQLPSPAGSAADVVDTVIAHVGAPVCPPSPPSAAAAAPSVPSPTPAAAVAVSLPQRPPPLRTVPPAGRRDGHQRRSGESVRAAADMVPAAHADEYDSAGPGEGLPYNHPRTHQPQALAQLPPPSSLPPSPGYGAEQRHPRTRSNGRAVPQHSGSGVAAGGGPSPRYSSPGTLSPALMHHIQHMRDHPSGARQEEHLTGWGLGSPAGGHIPFLNAASQSPPTGLPGFVPAPYQVPYPASMMGHMVQGQGMPMQMAMPGGMPAAPMVVAGGYPLPGSPRAYRAMAAAGFMQAGGQEGAGPPGAVMPAGMMAPAGWTMPYMQQAHQWAGTAPGYMTYQQHGPHQMHQHPYTATMRSMANAAAAATAVAAQQQHYHSAGQGGPVAGSTSSHNNSGPGTSSPKEYISDREATDANNQQPSNGQDGHTSSEGTSVAEMPSPRRPPPRPRRRTSSEDAATPRSSHAHMWPGAGPHPLPPAGPLPPATPYATGPGGGMHTGPTVGLVETDPNCTVYVGNLPTTVDEVTLAWTCGHCGPVTHVQVIREKGNQASRGYAFVTFAHPAYATMAMQQLNGQVMFGPFGGHKVKVAPTNKRV